MMPNQSNTWIRKALDRLRIEFGDCCQRCGSKTDLEFAHLKPTEIKGRSRGRKERYYDIKNNKTSYILLCHGCHKKLDEGKKNE